MITKRIPKMCRMVDRWCNYRVKSNGYRPSFRKIKQQQNNHRPVLPYFAKQGNRLIDGNSLEKKPGRGWAENRVGLIISLMSSKASMDVFSFTYAKLVRHDRLVVCYAIIYWTMPIISFFLLIEGGQHCQRNNEERWQVLYIRFKSFFWQWRLSWTWGGTVWYGNLGANSFPFFSCLALGKNSLIWVGVPSGSYMSNSFRLVI